MTNNRRHQRIKIILLLTLSLILIDITILKNMQQINNISNNRSNSVSDVNLFEIKTNFADSWEYYREITINSATPEADYQIKVQLNSTNFDYSKANANASDIRFYDQTQNPLSYWIEKWDNAGESIIWVKIPVSGTTTFYMYYGNPLVSSLSNGNDTFILFDDFEGSTLDLSKWYPDVDIPGAGEIADAHVSVSNSIAEIYLELDPDVWGGYPPEMRWELSVLGWHDYWATGVPYGWFTPNGIAIYNDDTRTHNPSVSEIYTDVTGPEWTWFVEEIQWVNSSLIKFLEDDVLLTEHINPASFPTEGTLPIKFLVQGGSYPNGNGYAMSLVSNNNYNEVGYALRTYARHIWDGNDPSSLSLSMQTDWILIHKCHESEPIASIGSEMLNDLNENEPVLSNGLVSPLIGDQNTEFTFSVNYTDFENNQPDFVDVIVNGSGFIMTKLIPSDINYTDGCIYEFSMYLIPSAYNYIYIFNCSDGKYTNSSMFFNNLEVNPANYFAPQLLNLQVTPVSGGLITTFEFSVWYFDEDNNLPTFVNLTIADTDFSMIQFNPSDFNAIDGILFYFNTALNFGFHSFQVNCSDGKFTNSTELIIGPEVNPFYGVPPIILLNPIYNAGLPADWINFSWISLNASFGTVNYSLQISSVINFSTLLYEIINISETPNTSGIQLDINLPTGIYYWRVRPTFSIFDGDWSNNYKLNIIRNDFAPILISDTIFPLSGNQNTIFKFTATYQDLDNNAPVSIRIIINGRPYLMEKQNPNDFDYTDGCIYQFLTLLTPSEEPYTYSLECYDGVFYDSTSIYEGPIVSNDVPIYDRNEGLKNRDSENVIALSISLIIGIGIVVPSIWLTKIKSGKIKSKSIIKSKTGLKTKQSISKKNK